MPRCETCGNDYDKAFEVIQNKEHHVFDSFECAIQALAPICAHCGCRVIGHGIEAKTKSSAAQTARKWKVLWRAGPSLTRSARTYVDAGCCHVHGIVDLGLDPM
jgi:hypothetical protein